MKRCFQEGKNADVAWGYSPLRHGQGALQLDEDGVHGQLAVFGAEPQASGLRYRGQEKSTESKKKKRPSALSDSDFPVVVVDKVDKIGVWGDIHELMLE